MAIRIIHITFFLLLFLLIGCKKKEDRRCWKGHGEEAFIEIPLDSAASFDLGKGIEYSIFQDTLKKIVVRGGSNMLNHVAVEDNNDTIYIENNNKCNFLRDNDRKIVVEIHYPYYHDFYIEPSDSVIFENTIKTDWLAIETREAGGSLRIDVEAGYLHMVVSHGTSDFTVSGEADYAEVKVQHQGFADATQLKAANLEAYQNSTANLRVNIDSTNAVVIIQGTGDVLYIGTPETLQLEGHGSGNLLEM